EKFDQITKTKTVQTLMENLQVPQVESYVDHLIAIFLDPTNQGKDNLEVSTMTSRRLWVVDQLCLLVRNTKVPRSDRWLCAVTRFLGLYSFFKPLKMDAGLSVTMAKPAVSPPLQAQIQARFSGVLADLIHHDLSHKDDAPHSSAEPRGKTPQRLWFYDSLKYIRDLETHKKVAAPTFEKPDDLEPNVKGAWALLDAIREKLANPKQIDTEVTQQLAAFQLLLLFAILQAYIEPDEAGQLLSDIEQCYHRLFKDPASKKGKKRKAEDAADGDAADADGPHPVEVLVDVILSILAKQPTLNRAVGEFVFRAFTGKLTAGAINLLFEILSVNTGVAGAEDLFENEDEDEEDGSETGAHSPPNGANTAHANGRHDTNGVDDDDKEGSEDDDEDDKDDDDSDASDVPDEFRQKVKEALGRLAVDSAGEDGEADDGDGNSSDESEFLDDEQMADFDDKLAEIFRERKRLKSNDKDATAQTQHLQLRVIDLLDIFARRHPSSPHLVAIAAAALPLAVATWPGSFEHASDAHAVAAAAPPEEGDAPPDDAPDAAMRLLRDAIALARKAPAAAVATLCARVAVFAARAVVAAAPHDSAAAAPTAKKSRKQQPEAAAAAEPGSSPSAAALAAVAHEYQAALDEFVGNRRARVQASLFAELAARLPAAALELATPGLRRVAAAGAAAKAHRVEAVFEMAVQAVQGLSPAEATAAAEGSVAAGVAGALAEALGAVVAPPSPPPQAQQGGKAGSGGGVGAARARKLLKTAAGAFRRLAKILGPDQLRAAVDTKVVTAAFARMRADPGLLNQPGARRLAAEVEALLVSGPPSTVPVGGGGRAQKK
ncbi:Myb-binding protein 1A, partial [Cladochytrium tenue]